MSAHEQKSFMDRYWQVFVIALGIFFAFFVGNFNPHL